MAVDTAAEKRFESRLGAVEQSIAGLTAEQHSQRLALGEIADAQKEMMALIRESNRPNFGLMISAVVLFLMIVGGTVAPLWFHIQDGHPARVEELVKSEEKRLDEYKLEAGKDRDRVADDLANHMGEGAHVQAAKDIAKLEGRVDALESGLQDIDKYGSRRWVSGE